MGLVALVLVAGRFAGAGEPPRPTNMPALDNPGAASCINNYPDRLAEYPIAFSGTPLVEEASSAARAELTAGDEGAEPFDVVFEVDRVYAGDLGETVRMEGVRFDRASQADERPAERYLIATTKEKALVACGYTRPWNEQDAAYWAHTFDGYTGPSGEPDRIPDRVGPITDVEPEPFNPSPNDSYTTPTSDLSGPPEETGEASGRTGDDHLAAHPLRLDGSGSSERAQGATTSTGTSFPLRSAAEFADSRTTSR